MVRHGKMRAALPLLSLKADISVRDLIKLSYNTMNICTFHNVYTSCIKMRLFVSTQFCGSPTNNFILPHPAHTSLFPSTPALAHQELSCTAPCCVGSRGPAVLRGSAGLYFVYIQSSSSSCLNAKYKLLPPAGMGELCSLIHASWLSAVVCPVWCNFFLLQRSWCEVRSLVLWCQFWIPTLR